MQQKQNYKNNFQQSRPSAGTTLNHLAYGVQNGQHADTLHHIDPVKNVFVEFFVMDVIV